MALCGMLDVLLYLLVLQWIPALLRFLPARSLVPALVPHPLAQSRTKEE